MDFRGKKCQIFRVDFKFVPGLEFSSLAGSVNCYKWNSSVGPQLKIKYFISLLFLFSSAMFALLQKAVKTEDTCINAEGVISSP